MDAQAATNMRNLRRFGTFIPSSVKLLIRRALPFVTSSLKYQDEIAYWRAEWAGGRFQNDYYRETMLAMSGQDEAFLTGKIVADFGCGPQGSLAWATTARLRIGIDVLAHAYSEFGIRSHGMVYVRSTERSIPLPTNFVDVMFTMNALDHVSRLRPICDEIRRVMVPGGRFFGSFNMCEPATFAEPQTLTEEKLNDELLKYLDVQFYKIGAPHRPGEDVYRAFRTGEYIDKAVPGAHLWVRATKPIS